VSDMQTTKADSTTEGGLSARGSTADVVRLLQAVPLFAGLRAGVLERLAGDLRRVKLSPGEWLFNEGDPADNAYLIRSGRLAVIADVERNEVVRVLRRGALVGELALLLGGTRSMAVRAERDSELLAISGASFEKMLLESPEFVLGLMRAIARQLASIPTPAVAPEPPRGIAVVALEPQAPAGEATIALTRALGGLGSVTSMEPSPDSAELWSARLSQSEADNDHVILDATATPCGDAWTDFCLREADVTLAITGGRPDRAWLARPALLRGCDLLVVGARWDRELLSAFEPGSVQVTGAGADFAATTASIARRYSGRAIGLVLSGGGARALAHVGVADELQRAGLKIDCYGGTSLGSVVAAGLAMGVSPDEALAMIKHYFVEHNPNNDYTLPISGLIRGRKTERALAEFFGDVRIEELPTRFFCVSCDLQAQELVVHRTGSLVGALRATTSLPGLFPPVAPPDGRLLVDGGVLDNLPVQTLASLGEGPVIAVDVGLQRARHRSSYPRDQDRLLRAARRAITGTDVPLPRLPEILVRTLTLGSTEATISARRAATMLIEPDVANVGILDWKQWRYLLDAGRRAAREALERQPDLFAVAADPG
jgi:NTE family protein